MPHIETADEIEDPRASEETPLLPGDPRKGANGTSSPDSEPPKTDLRIILPALMVCAFLAAFDVTVVAAIYPIMFAHLALDLP
jgi:hypothetical protein